MRFVFSALIVVLLIAPCASAQRPVASSVAKKEYLRIGASPLSAGMRVGESRQFSAIYVNSRDMVPASPTWRSSDSKVISVDSAGNVTGVAPGKAKVIVTDGVTTFSAQVTVSK